MKRINVQITSTAAMIVSTSTTGFKIGSGCSIFARQAMVCFVAIALITNGNVNAAQLGLNFNFKYPIAFTNAMTQMTVATASITSKNVLDFGVTDCT